VTVKAPLVAVCGRRGVAPSGIRSGVWTRTFGVAGLGLIAACSTASDAPQKTFGIPLRVMNDGTNFTDSEGALARKKADAACAARGQRLQSSIYDRYEAGAWVFVEGCA
jgi:hypothetical protein